MSEELKRITIVDDGKSYVLAVSNEKGFDRLLARFGTNHLEHVDTNEGVFDSASLVNGGTYRATDTKEDSFNGMDQQEHEKEEQLSKASELVEDGIALCDEGKYAEALDLFQEALGIQLKVLGDGHPDVAWSYNNIGIALNGQGQYEEAIKMHEKALEIRMATLDNRHELVADSYYNMGCVLGNQAKCKEAVEMFRQALDIYLEVHGNRHEDVANTYHEMGIALYCQVKYKEAVEMFRKFLDIYVEVDGEGHEKVLNARKLVAKGLELLGQHGE